MRALIIDDEPMPAKHLREMIRQYCFEINNVQIIQSPVEAIQHLQENEYDIVFIDVEMPEMNGVEFLQKVSLPRTTSIIFSTAYSEYAVDAFKANATHYIMKPVEEKELVLAIRKVLDKRTRTKTSLETISVFDGSEYSIVHQKDILYLKAEGSYTQFVLQHKKIMTSKRLGYFEDKLNEDYFIRCHNSYLVNTLHIDKLGKQKSPYLVLSNADTIPVSASKRAELESRLGLH